ncbi:MAG: MarR family transcriptional regulator [Candidatus Altiarchaeota archaeon]|nr:MarR family transcriptional regulator [Candidatus Altiarchaeota archaeon]
MAKLLPAHERIVLSLLFANRTMTQEELTTKTGLSRLAVSRTISRLEEKGVITKKPQGNTNIIESRLYRIHYSTQLLTRLPGLSEERMMLAIAAVFLFGLSVSVLNNYHIIAVEHPLEPSLYLIAIEFFAIGSLANLLLRKHIAAAQFERTLGILPADEKNVLKTVYNRNAITQGELVEKTGIYKMKVSRILDKFQQKGVIEKKPQGYTNLIISRIS